MISDERLNELLEQADDACEIDLTTALHELTALRKLHAPYKLYVWRRQPLCVITAHATSVARARELALEESRGDGDASTPVRRKAYEAVQTTTPEIHYRENAEFVLTDSALLQESDQEVEELKVLLERSLRLCLSGSLFGEGADLIKEAKRHGVKV